MLQSIRVENFALIDELVLEPEHALNVFTGETGAGKSVIIDAVTTALGKNAPKDIIRKGEDHALVELVFSDIPDDVKALLREEDIPESGDEILISRRIGKNRSVSRINGESVSLKILSEVTAGLIDIHGQHEHQSLLKKEKQLEMVDRFGKEEQGNIPVRLSEIYKELSSLEKTLLSMDSSPEERAREADLLRFEIEEIDEAALKPGEDELLEERFKRLENSEKIREALSEAAYLLGNDSGAAAMTGKALSGITVVAELDKDVEAIRDALLDADNILTDISRDVGSYLDKMDNEAESFSETEDRLNVINRIKTKYGQTLEKIFLYRDEKEKELEKLSGYQEEIESIKRRIEDLKAQYGEMAHKLSKIRKKTAEDLEKRMIRAMEDLNFLTVDMKILFGEKEPTSKGIDDITFLISLNPGEDLKPLSDVASGGELSRIMLALKSVLAQADSVKTLIFDEIDTGISGRTAQKVAEKLFGIGKDHQVICITHLPQIAAMADTQFLIEKAALSDKTVTTVQRLDREGEIKELARMSGGAEITEGVSHNAKEMKELADKLKSQMR